MVGTVAAMDVRLATAVAGEIGDVSAFCRSRGISRKTFYKWKARFDADGLSGLEPRSRRPARSPGETPPAVQEAILRRRKELAEAGCDHGPDPIRWALLDAEDLPVGQVPSRSTIARILSRHGLVTATPQRRPRSSYRRFVYRRPNGCWQSDWTAWHLADGRAVAIAGTLDDHSRLLVGLGAGLGDGTGELVWSVMAAAIERFGVPQMSLTDNGLCYSTARRRLTAAAFETNLRALGCQPVTSSPYHPQTCGKIERFWQTLKKWLLAGEARHGAATSLDQLNTRLTEFRRYYNHDRPHRAHHGATPAAVFTATDPARPAARPLPAPLTVHHGIVRDRGQIQVGPYQVHLGSRWAGTNTTAIKDGNHIAVFTGNQLIRVLDADPTRRYQPATHS
jgi:transposase InsO family protein